MHDSPGFSTTNLPDQMRLNLKDLIMFYKELIICDLLF